LLLIKFMKSKSCIDKKSVGKLLQTVEFLKIISEENRLKILCFLMKEEKCVCDIWQYLKLPQNLVSHHLKVLKDFNLVFSKRKGLKVAYKLNKKVVKKYLKLLNKFLDQK